MAVEEGTAALLTGSGRNGYQRQLGFFALLTIGLGSIIGSGWLFGAWKASKVAGPAAVFAWLIGAVVILLIGIAYTELGAMFPRSGGMVRYAQYSHGSLAGFIGGWSNWIAIVSVIPVEAQASVQYMSSWPWAWAQALYNGTDLQPTGLAIAGLLVVIYFLINYWTVKLFATANGVITVLKVVIPGLTVLGLVLAHFAPGNFTQHGGFTPNGWPAVLTAVATSGVVFAFNGFQSPVNVAGEARNPGRNVPMAVIGSILIATVIYLGLQVAYIGAVPGSALAHGWSALNFHSPFADLALAWNLNWLAILLYGDAFVSPSGTGMTYTATTARMIQGMQENGYLPRILGYVDPRYGVPRPAMWLNLLVAFIFMLLFRGWGSLASVISVATIISYATGPVAVVVLRRIAPEAKRPLTIPWLRVIAPVAFALASLVLYWARWPLTGEVILIMAIGLPIYFYYQSKTGFTGFRDHLRGGLWLVVYLFWMALLSALGSAKFGGLGLLPFGWDMALVAVSSLGFYAWGLRSGFLNQYLRDAVADDLEQRNAEAGAKA
jgi:amino acid transporter